MPSVLHNGEDSGRDPISETFTAAPAMASLREVPTSVDYCRSVVGADTSTESMCRWVAATNYVLRAPPRPSNLLL